MRNVKREIRMRIGHEHLSHSVCYHLENQVCSPLTENKIGTSCKIARMIAGKLKKLSSKIWILEKLEAPQMNGRKELLKIVKKG